MRRKPLPPTRKPLLAAGLAVFLAGGVQADDDWTLSASEWSRPRSGAAVLSMTPVAEAVRAWHAADAKNGSARLLLVHPGGEEGSLWAAELRDWLVALGVPSRAVETVAGGQAPDELEIRLQK